MTDLHSNMQPPFSFDRESFLYGNDQQSLYACILDAINNEIDVIVNLLLEGNKLVEAMDEEINAEKITTIVKNTNNHLYQHIMKMNSLKSGMRKNN